MIFLSEDPGKSQSGQNVHNAFPAASDKIGRAGGIGGTPRICLLVRLGLRSSESGNREAAQFPTRPDSGFHLTQSRGTVQLFGD